MLLTALTLMGYSVGMSLASSAIMKDCIDKGSTNATKRIESLSEDHDSSVEATIIDEEQKKATRSFAIKTAVLGVAAGAVATGIIYNFDNPMLGTSNDHHSSTTTISTAKSVPVVASDDATTTTTNDGVTTTTIGGVEITTF